MAKAGKIRAPQLTHLLMWAVLVVLFVMFLRAVGPILLPFAVGMLMAYLFDPMADRMEARGVSRGLAAALITLGFFSILVALVVWIGPILYTQLAELIEKLPAVLQQGESLIREQTAPLFRTINHLTGGNPPDGVPQNSSEMLQKAISLGGDFVSHILASSVALLDLLSLLLITPIVSFYLLRDWDRMVAYIDTLLPRAYAETIRAQAKEVSNTLSGYLRGQLYVMFILTVFYVIVLTVLGLKYSLLLGVLTGTLVIIPYLGTWISVGISLFVAYGQFEFTTTFWLIVAAFVVGHVVEVQVLTPKVIGKRVGLHPLWLLFGMLAGAVLIGFVGILLAIPITAVISVGVRFLIGLYLDSSLYKDA